jgi:hypothetical protein
LHIAHTASLPGDELHINNVAKIIVESVLKMWKTAVQPCV